MDDLQETQNLLGDNGNTALQQQKEMEEIEEFLELLREKEANNPEEPKISFILQMIRHSIETKRTGDNNPRFCKTCIGYKVRTVSGLPVD